MERVIDGRTRTFYYQTNQLGTIAALTEWEGDTESIVERYTYDAYGRLIVQTPGADGEFGTSDDDYGATSSVGNPYTFTARRLDTETGLMYFRARYYSLWQGRFASREPIGYADGMNLYTAYFVPNAVDPEGEGILGIGAGLIMGGTAAYYAVKALVVTYGCECGYLRIIQCGPNANRQQHQFMRHSIESYWQCSTCPPPTDVSFPAPSPPWWVVSQQRWPRYDIPVGD